MNKKTYTYNHVKQATLQVIKNRHFGGLSPSETGQSWTWGVFGSAPRHPLGVWASGEDFDYAVTFHEAGFKEIERDKDGFRQYIKREA